MEESKEIVQEESVTVDAPEKPSNIFDTAKDAIVKAADVNADGNLDLKDVAVVADSIGVAAAKAAGAVKEAGDQIGKFLSRTKRDLDLKTLRPLFVEDIRAAGFSLPELIHLTTMDKRHAVSEVCKGSIAHMSSFNGMDMINIYKDHIDKFGLKFYPDRGSEVYYKDPCVKMLYIALDEYFIFLDKARMNELESIAQSLGAKQYLITYTEKRRTEKSKTVGIKAEEKVGLCRIGEEAKYNISKIENADVNMTAKKRFEGHEPIKPKVLYFKNDPTIKGLIKSRMDPHGKSTYAKYSFECRKLSGIKINDAKKIDMLLRAAKCSIGINIVEAAEKEEHRFLQFEIEF